MTIKLMMLLFAAALCASCNQRPEAIPGYEGTRLNPDFLADIEIVSSLMTAWMLGDTEVMERHMHQDFVATGPDPESRYTRQEEIDRWVEFAEDYDNTAYSNEIFYSWIVDEMEDRPELVGKWVVNWSDVSFRQKEDGRQIGFPVHVAFRFREGQVDFVHYLYDRLSMAMQMGYRLVPEETAEE